MTTTASGGTMRRVIDSGLQLLPAGDSRIRLGLLAVCLAQYLSVLDGLIVSVALPAISADLQLDTSNVHWVFNAYTIPYAGLLLLGGKAADQLGRRRAFTFGQLLLLVGSLLGGMAGSSTLLFAGRAIQALGAAVSLPAAIALLADAFRDEQERSKAFGILTIGGGVGWLSAAFLGGILTERFGWEAVFFLNIPLTVAAILLGRFLPRSQAEGDGRGLDLAGAGLVVATLSILVYTAGRVEQTGLGSSRTVLPALVGIGLGGLFVVVERRVRSPLVPLQLFRLPSIAGAGVLGLIMPVGFIASQFLGTLHLQNVLGLDPARAGLLFLPLSVMPLIITPLVSRLYPRFGVANTVAAGFAVVALGLALLALASPSTGYMATVLPGFVLVGAGVTAVYVPLAVASVTGVSDRDYGLASGIFQTSNQIGGALTLAVLATVAAAFSGIGADGATDSLQYRSSGLRAAFVAGALACAVAAVAALPLLRRVEQASSRT